MSKRRVMEVAAMLMIGEGIICLFFPRRHVLLWKFGPPVYRDAMDKLAERPNLARALGLLEAALGLWLAVEQEKN